MVGGRRGKRGSPAASCGADDRELVTRRREKDRDALDSGDLPLVKATAAQLSAVDLPTALEITLLIAAEELHNAERAALRWPGRGALESREAALDGPLEATVAMSALAQEPERWDAVLRRLVGT